MLTEGTRVALDWTYIGEIVTVQPMSIFLMIIITPHIVSSLHIQFWIL